MLRAFEALWAAGRDARLVVAGRLSPDAKEELAFFARHRENPRLVVLEQPADDTLRQLLRGARAVIMPSEAEGFGLPPYEALQAGDSLDRQRADSERGHDAARGHAFATNDPRSDRLGGRNVVR